MSKACTGPAGDLVASADRVSFRDEGAAYMVAMLAEVRSHRAGSEELSTLLQFLSGGPMLAGACAELCRAVHGEAQP